MEMKEKKGKKQKKSNKEKKKQEEGQDAVSPQIITRRSSRGVQSGRSRS